MDNVSNKNAARVFANAFARCFTDALTEAIELPARFKVLDSPDLANRRGKPVHYRLTVGGALRGECFVEFYEPQVADLGAKILRRTAAGFSEEHGEALGTVISSALAALTASLSGEFGDLSFKLSRVADLAFGGMLVVPLAVSLGELPDMPVLLYFDGVFLRALSCQSVTIHAGGAERLPIDPMNLRLVMDVELNVSLRFGQRQLPLREVLELASGSVIELDRQVDEPVELLLDGKVIARGEAVIVDGNYGLRVTEVPQPIASQLLAI